ncbi:MAG: LysM peptidoglycan-binding domain-containing protein [Actinobacteria bacterium]|nr:LysM peptidoglycan-binding domain-containing protein [Actinomycetota bacterium]NBR67295.1 LysM peptidoglycan-binding domain-containing protein [Actinomycetota bacterium]
MTATIDPLLITASPRRGTARQARPARPVTSQATYRRRRMVVAAVAVFAVASPLFVTGAFATEPSAQLIQTVPRTHVVEAGQTLWSIARLYMPTGNISEFVSELARMNGVDIEVGQIIRIP